MAVSIDQASAVVAEEIASLIQASQPTESEIASVRRQLMSRHSELKLERQILSEEIAEAFFRCRLTDHLMRRFDLDAAALPDCINASHRAVRRVCSIVPHHEHLEIPDAQWTAGWTRMQVRHPSVNVKIPGRRASRHADLYVIAGAKVVSLEFKYVGGSGLRDVTACLEQVRRHAEHHEKALFVVYSDARNKPDLSPVRAGLLKNAQLVHVAGPAMPPVED